MASVRTAAWFSVLALCGAAEAQTPGFWLTGVAPGSTASAVNALSQSGVVAVGGNSGGTGGPGSHAPGFTWTASGGRSDFGLLPGMPAVSYALGVSSDGSVLAGITSPTYGGNPEPDHAFRWAGSGPIQDLGLLPGGWRSYAGGISGDGQKVVGWCESTVYRNRVGEAFLWTPQGGMVGLGYTRPGGTISEASAISRDGSTVVGYSQAGFGGPLDAFVWTQSTGMRALPPLPGAFEPVGIARAVNADGSVIVGQSVDGADNSHAVRWIGGVAQDLGTLPGLLHYSASAVSDDGGVIVGSGDFGDRFPFVWTPGSGMVLLSDYFSSRGVSVPAGWRLEDVLAISGDGLTFAGYVRDLASGQTQGFVATVPSPAPFLVLVLPALRFQRRRRALI